MKPWNRFYKFFVFVICSCFLLIGIGYVSINQNRFLTKDESTNEQPLIGTPTPPMIAPDVSDKGEGSNQSIVPKVVTNSDIYLTTSNFDKTHSDVEQLIMQVEGVVQAATISTNNAVSESAKIGNEMYKTAYLSVKIATPKRESFIASLQQVATLSSINTYSYDQSQSYTDIENRLKNLQVQEQRYRELIQQAKTLNEILMIEPELTRIRTEIDSLVQQKETMDDQVKYSIVNITLQEVKQTEALDKNFVELVKAQWQANTNQIIYLFQWGAVKLIGFIPYIVVLSPVFIFIAVVVRRFKKHK